MYFQLQFLKIRWKSDSSRGNARASAETVADLMAPPSHLIRSDNLLADIWALLSAADSANTNKSLDYVTHALVIKGRH